jgi:hypothetical protein
MFGAYIMVETIENFVSGTCSIFFGTTVVKSVVDGELKTMAFFVGLNTIIISAFSFYRLLRCVEIAVL